MNKLTLPIEPGKRYVRRDGAVVTALMLHNHDFLSMSDGGIVWADCGVRSKRGGEHPFDLIADADADADQPHIHAENMRLYAEDAARTDEPWLLWESQDEELGHSWATETFNPTWSLNRQYRRKPTKEKQWVNLYLHSGGELTHGDTHFTKDSADKWRQECEGHPDTYRFLQQIEFEVDV